MMATLDDPWALLLNYESTELVRRQFRQRHQRSLSLEKASEVCVAIAQARNYMTAAKSSDRNVRPLLTYYSSLSLSRALTLFLSTSLRESGLAQAHGLNVVGWESLSSPQGDVSSLKMKIARKGTLRQLIDATGHKSNLRSNSSKSNFTHIHDVPAPDSEVEFGELLARIGEVRDALFRWKEIRRVVGIWPQGETSDGKREIRVDLPFDERDVDAVLGSLMSLKSKQGGVLIYAINKDAIVPSFSDMNGRWNIGTLLVVSKMPGDIELSKIALAFAVSYALGMLVRYYPSYWLGMLRNDRHNEALPTLLAALDFTEEWFPRMVLEFLE